MIKIISGPPRSDKVRVAVDSILPDLRENRCSEILILVPSNLKVVEIRNRLLDEEGIEGFFDLKILTFLDLTRRAFGDSPLPGKESTPLTRRWMVQSILEQLPLTHLNEVRETRGIVTLALEIIRTLKEAGITPAEFQKRVSSGKASSALMEMAAIYSVYEEERQRRELLDREDLFPLAAEQFREAPSRGFSRLRRVLITGFYDFTPVQMKLISSLAGLKTVEEVTITLLHQEGKGPAHAFTERTLDRLRIFLPRAEVVSPNPEDVESGPLDRLGRSFLADREVVDRTSSDKTIEIFNTPGRYREVEEIARKIRGLIRDEARHFKDFAVVFRNLDDYRDKIVEVFRFFKIPHHLATGAHLRSNPLVQTVMGILEVPGSGYRREAVARLLRSHYVRFEALEENNLPAERFDTLAREAMIHGGKEEWKERLRGSRELLQSRMDFLESGDLESSDLEGRAARIAKIRAKLSEYDACGNVVEQLIKVLDSLRKRATLRQFAETIHDLIRQFEMEKRIYETKDLRLIGRDQEALKKFQEILQQIAENHETLLSRKKFSLREVIRLLNLALSETTYAPDKPGEDAALVIDAQGMRELHRPVVFVGGLVEESFPLLHSPPPVFGENERIQLNGKLDEKRWVPLAVYWREEEELLFSLAVAAATQRLILTYPRADAQGRDLLPSRYIEQVRSLFTEESLSTQEFSLKDPLPEPEEIFRSKELLEFTFRGLHRLPSDAPLAPLLFRHLLEHQKEKVHKLLHGLRVIAARKVESPEYSGHLGAESTARLREDERSFAVTALEKYGSCPFRYFCERVLALQPVEEVEDEIGAMDIGSLVHRILERFYRKVGGAVTPDNVDQCRKIMQDVAERVLSHAESEGIPGHGKLWEIRKEEVRQVLGRFVEKEMEEYVKTQEVPTYFEASFGVEPSARSDSLSTAEPLTIESEGGPIRIMGKVDRIDLGEEEGKPAFSIVDYKTGKKALSVQDILRGESLQLPVYAHWVEKVLPKNREFHSASFYLLRSGEKKTQIPGKDLPWKDIEKISQGHIRNYVESIRQGEFPVTEKKCPEYCAYHSICRIREE